MNPVDFKHSTPCRRITALLLTLVIVVSAAKPSLADESLDLPLPRTATNAALHYQRAILFLVAVDPAKREVLGKPIWEIITPDSTDADIAKVDQLLIASRHAIRSALVGANQLRADFGLDIRQYMLSAALPHTQPMVDLAKLNTLHGMQRESSGDWKSAAEIHLATARMGRHMTHQTTLDEALAGVEILETAYYALGHWATHCPETALIEQVLDLVAASSGHLVHPARTLYFEASISQMRLDAMQDAFPDGPWAEMVIESLNVEFPNEGPEGMRAAAIAAATQRGVPKEAFDNQESFSRYMQKMRSIYVALARESAGCLTQSPPGSIRQGEAVYQKYKPKLLNTERSSKLNPARIAALFAVHEAELSLTQLILAISAAKTADGFPSTLGAVTEKLGGELPLSPYDGSPFVYESLENGNGFSISVQAASVGEVELPEIKFEHLPVGPAAP